MFAGCLMPDREGARGLTETCSDRLRIVPIDVTDDWQVRGAVKYVKENIGDDGKALRAQESSRVKPSWVLSRV